MELDKPLRPWVLRVHLNHCRSLLRRRRIRRWLRLDEIPEPAAPSPSSSPERPALEDLLRLAKGLSLRQREAWLLCDLEGQDSTTAALALGCRPETVRVHLMRARVKLRTAWRRESAGGRHESGI